MSSDDDTQNPSGVQGRGSFKDSREFRFRREIRDAIKSGPFTRGEREVVLAFVNHWLHHRNSTKGCVHPGRKKLAKRADVSIRTVSRCLELLREHGAIDAVAHLEGLHGNATEYTVSVVHLLQLCKLKKSDLAVNGGTNVPGSGRDKMSRRNNTSLNPPIQKIDNIIAFPLVRGAA